MWSFHQDKFEISTCGSHVTETERLSSVYYCRPPRLFAQVTEACTTFMSKCFVSVPCRWCQRMTLTDIGQDLFRRFKVSQVVTFRSPSTPATFKTYLRRTSVSTLGVYVGNLGMPRLDDIVTQLECGRSDTGWKLFTVHSSDPPQRARAQIQRR